MFLRFSKNQLYPDLILPERGLFYYLENGLALVTEVFSGDKEAQRATGNEISFTAPRSCEERSRFEWRRLGCG